MGFLRVHVAKQKRLIPAFDSYSALKEIFPGTLMSEGVGGRGGSL